MNTTYFLNCVAGNMFHTQENPSIPTSYYIGLSTTEPTTSGSNVTEPTSATGYSRVLLDSLSVPDNGVVSNSYSITFEESTASWGTITHFLVFDDETDGNLLMYGELTTARTVEAATIMTIKAGYLTLSAQNPDAV